MTAEIPHTPEQDDLKERRSDQGVWNGTMGEAALKGAFEVTKPVSHTRPMPHGRGNPRIGEGDHDVDMSPGNVLAPGEGLDAYLRHKEDIQKISDQLDEDDWSQRVKSGERKPAEKAAHERARRERLGRKQ